MVEHIVHCLYARHYAALLAYLDLYEVGVKYYAVLNGCKIDVAGRAVFACPDCLHEVIAEGGEEVLGYRLASVHGEVILRAVLVAVKHYYLAAELAYLRPHLTVRSIKAEIVCRQGVSSRLARAAHRRKLIVGKVFPCQLFRRLDIPPERRPVTTVFQSYGLFPHMTVLQNVLYGLKFQRIRRSDAREKGLRYLDMVGLSDYAGAYIHEISGGQQQRVALARALIVEPKLCLLDEPFSNLDAALRTRMRQELKNLQRELGMTMVFVTHDQEEALILADRMAIMEKGRLIQYDSPLAIYHNPADRFVADFLGLEDLEWRQDGALLKIIRRDTKEET